MCDYPLFVQGSISVPGDLGFSKFDEWDVIEFCMNSESMNSLEAPQSKRAWVLTVCFFVPIATGNNIDWGVISATSTEETIKSERSDVAPSLLIKNPLSPFGRQSHLSLLCLICP
jgi:hypothetical protein